MMAKVAWDESFQSPKTMTAMQLLKGEGLLSILDGAMR